MHMEKKEISVSTNASDAICQKYRLTVLKK